MGDKDFIKPILERKGTVHFGKVAAPPPNPLNIITLTPLLSPEGHHSTHRGFPACSGHRPPFFYSTTAMEPLILT